MGPDSKVLFWNGAMERLFGWSAEEMLGKTLPVVPPNDGRTPPDSSAYTGWRRVLTAPITRVAKDGTPIEVSLSTWPIRGAAGRVTAIIGI